jgi:hypothetical protein
MAILRMTPSGGTPVDYVLVPFRDGTHVRRPRNQDFNTPFRQGPQSPRSLDAYQSLIFPNFSLGLGRDRINSDSALKIDEYRRFFDATADTRWESGVYGPIQEEDTTHTGLQVVRDSAHFKGNFWTIWEDDDSTDIVARKFTGSTNTWEGGGNVLADSNVKVGLALKVVGTHMLALFATTNDHVVHRSTDGVSWAAASTPLPLNLLTNVVTAYENQDFGLLAEIGGEAVAVLWHETNSTITFFTSTDAGDTWADEAVDIVSGNGPQGVAVLAGIDNEDKLYVCTREGLWEIDTAPSTWTTRLIFPMAPNVLNGTRMVVHNGSLWFSQSYDNDTPPAVYRMTVSDGRRTIEPVPNDFSQGDGLAAEATGQCEWMVSAGGMVWISVGGAAGGRHARIMCHNGKGWHVMRRHGTQTLPILWMGASSEDDAVPRLFYGIKVSGGVSNVKFLRQPFANPASGVAIKREATGYIDLPYVDFGHPHANKNVLRVGINAKDLVDTSNEYINVDYGWGSDLGAPTARGSFTNLGDFVPATSHISLGSGVGLNARTFALRVNIITDTAGNTTAGVLFDVSIDGYVVLPPTDMFEFMVDLKATDDLLGAPAGTTITNLNTARAETLLLALTYADAGTIYVRIPPDAGGLNFSEEIVDMGVSGANAVDPNQRLEGIATVRVVQPIA